MPNAESRLAALEALVRDLLVTEDALNVMTSEGTVRLLQHKASIVAQLRQAVRP